MVTSSFDLDVERKHLPYALTYLPDDWRVTDWIGYSDYSTSPVLDHSNYECILSDLRALEGEVEGNLTGYPDYAVEPDNATWFEFGGYIAWRSTLTDEDLEQQRRYGYWDRDADTPSVLQCLIDLNERLAQYPVLDEDDYGEREYDAALEAIDCCTPIGLHLTDEQQHAVYRFLSGDGDGRFAVEFADHDYSVWDRSGHGNLDDAVRHACYCLGYLPLHKHGEYERRSRKLPYRTKTRTLVHAWRAGRIPYTGLAYIDRRGLRQALVTARAQAKERAA